MTEPSAHSRVQPQHRYILDILPYLRQLGRQGQWLASAHPVRGAWVCPLRAFSSLSSEVCRVLCSGQQHQSHSGAYQTSRFSGPTLRPPKSEPLESGPRTLRFDNLSKGFLCTVGEVRPSLKQGFYLYWRKWVTMSPFMKTQAAPRRSHST